MNTISLKIATKKLFLILSALVLPGLAAGCSGGNEGPSLAAVAGTVQYDGAPIEEGRITFRADAGAGRAYSTDIKNGAFSLEVEPGKAKVEVIASRVIPGKFGEAASPDKEPPPLSEMYIPAKYNTETTLEAEVTTGENNIPFNLEAN